MSAEAFRSYRVGIAGASSLRGKELKTLMEEGSFPAPEIRLFDDETAVGTLTEAGGEPAFIQAVDADSFHNLDFVFFAGNPAFTRKVWPLARKSGARVIDLSGALAEEASAAPWIPALDAALPPPRTADASLVFSSPPAPAVVACTLAAGLRAFQPRRLAIVFLRPVSERGQAGVEELERQTVGLLSFQPIERTVYDAQVAFNLISRYGDASTEALADERGMIARATNRYLAGRLAAPAIQLIQAPVFYSYAFTAFADLAQPETTGAVEEALRAVSVQVQEEESDAPNNVSVAGESAIQLGRIEADMNSPGDGLWLWGATDNVRLAAANALAIAERLLAS
jgi:aspartate-semialdehyde dehydrogenase